MTCIFISIWTWKIVWTSKHHEHESDLYFEKKRNESKKKTKEIVEKLRSHEKRQNNVFFDVFFFRLSSSKKKDDLIATAIFVKKIIYRTSKYLLLVADELMIEFQRALYQYDMTINQTVFDMSSKKNVLCITNNAMKIYEEYFIIEMLSKDEHYHSIMTEFTK